MSRQLPQAASEDVQMPENLNTGRQTGHTGKPDLSGPLGKRAREAKERPEEILVFDQLAARLPLSHSHRG